MRRLTIPVKICNRCGKGSTVGVNKPNSQHRTKRVVMPNLQKYTDPTTNTRVLLCTRCIRTLNKAN